MQNGLVLNRKASPKLHTLRTESHTLLGSTNNYHILAGQIVAITLNVKKTNNNNKNTTYLLSS